MDKEMEAKILEMFEEEHESLEIVEEGDWIVDYKYQYCDTIVKYEDKFYQISQQRAGSYYSDYDYYNPCIQEVELVEVVKFEWKLVK